MDHAHTTQSTPELWEVVYLTFSTLLIALLSQHVANPTTVLKIHSLTKLEKKKQNPQNVLELT